MKLGIFSTLPLSALLLSFSVSAFAAPQVIRWTGSEDKNAELGHVLAVIKTKTGIDLTAQDFQKIEDRDLATSHFVMLAQQSGGTPIHGASLRLWTDLKSSSAIQVEASLENPATVQKLGLKQAILNLLPSWPKFDVGAVVRQEVASSDDRRIESIKLAKFWKDGELTQIAKVKSRRGYHTIVVSLAERRVVSHTYAEFPQQDQPSSEVGQTGEFSVPVQVYPIYEEVETDQGKLLPRISSELKYLKSSVAHTAVDPYGPLRAQHYYENKFDPILGLTEEGRKEGFWSMAYLKDQAAALRAGLPLSLNSFKNGGVILEGRYATVNLHPGAVAKFPGINFTPAPSIQFKPDWVTAVVDGQEMGEMIPKGSLLGKPLASLEDAWSRPARRLPEHPPVEYINDGFDEIQVYYAVNTLVDSLHQMGFTDPELSTRTFNAFMYDPDISMRDNAYYTDDTINFTTYSPKQINFARDNSTIWHELGHGIMDRLMGDNITLADTGGLSEGMADFVAALVIADKMEGQTYPGMEDYRIINKTGFFLTNEVHDDGEAYGGAMNDLLQAAIRKEGRTGLKKVTDLTLETMRLTRDNPALTAQDWFGHMLFADERGSDLRASGELRSLVIGALEGRNFSLEGKKSANYSLKNGTQEIVANSPGSRQNPLKAVLDESATGSYQLQVALEDGDAYKFQYPVQVKVQLKGGPIQGAIAWVGGEETRTFTLTAPGQKLPIDLAVSGKCEFANRDDGSCVDYAYVQIWDATSIKKPVAKKRFYLRVLSPAAAAAANTAR
jgi:hypothetical protein